MKKTKHKTLLALCLCLAALTLFTGCPDMTGGGIPGAGGGAGGGGGGAGGTDKNWTAVTNVADLEGEWNITLNETFYFTNISDILSGNGLSTTQQPDSVYKVKSCTVSEYSYSKSTEILTQNKQAEMEFSKTDGSDFGDAEKAILETMYPLATSIVVKDGAVTVQTEVPVEPKRVTTVKELEEAFGGTIQMDPSKTVVNVLDKNGKVLSTVTNKEWSAITNPDDLDGIWSFKSESWTIYFKDLRENEPSPTKEADSVYKEELNWGEAIIYSKATQKLNLIGFQDIVCSKLDGSDFDDEEKKMFEGDKAYFEYNGTGSVDIQDKTISIKLLSPKDIGDQQEAVLQTLQINSSKTSIREVQKDGIVFIYTKANPDDEPILPENNWATVTNPDDMDGIWISSMETWTEYCTDIDAYLTNKETVSETREQDSVYKIESKWREVIKYSKETQKLSLREYDEFIYSKLDGSDFDQADKERFEGFKWAVDRDGSGSVSITDKTVTYILREPMQDISNQLEKIKINSSKTAVLVPNEYGGAVLYTKGNPDDYKDFEDNSGDDDDPTLPEGTWTTVTDYRVLDGKWISYCNLYSYYLKDISELAGEEEPSTTPETDSVYKMSGMAVWQLQYSKSNIWLSLNNLEGVEFTKIDESAFTEVEKRALEEISTQMGTPVSFDMSEKTATVMMVVDEDSAIKNQEAGSVEAVIDWLRKFYKAPVNSLQISSDKRTLRCLSDNGSELFEFQKQ